MNWFSDNSETESTKKLSPIFLATRDLTGFPLYGSRDGCWLNGTGTIIFLKKNHCLDKKDNIALN